MTVESPAAQPSALAVADNELACLIRSRFSIVFIDSLEEARAEAIVASAARACGRTTWTWSISDGLTANGAPPRQDTATADPKAALEHIVELGSSDVFVMRDLARHVADDPVVERLLRDIARDLDATLILLGPHGPIPNALATVSASFALPRPDLQLIEAHVRARLAAAIRAGAASPTADDSAIHAITYQLRGLTLEQVDQVLAHLLYDDGRLDAGDVARAASEKARMLAVGGVVSLETTEFGLDWVAGFPNLKSWIGSRGRAFGEDARAYGLEPPRGLLLTGVPGCGKSFVAKAIAHDWGMPLLRLDAGSLYDSFVGASERNLREALALAEALAPSILWIDEIEKGFGSTGPSQSDGGLGYRMLGSLATWMQEREAPVFMLATSNDITKLPPELTRQGRFDETFFVDLPDASSREHLYRLQMARNRRAHDRYDCPAFAAASEGFSGAEIEQSVTNAMYRSFGEQRDLTNADVLAETGATRPLAALNPAAIDAIRNWGTTHARPA